MGDVTIEFVPPLEVTQAAFLALGASFRSMREPLKRAVSKVLIPSIGANFASGGRPSWPGLKRGTLDAGGSRPLVRSGTLEGVATSPGIWSYDVDMAYVTGLPGAQYGGVHQFGADSSGHGAKIPARPFLVIQPEDEEAIEEVFAEWVDERIVAIWARSGGGI